jgi:Flp pilus assembly pilin Flp
MEIMTLRKFNDSESGQGLVEYALIIVSVALVLIFSLSLTGTTLRGAYCKVVKGVGGSGCGCESSFDDPSEIDSWEGGKKEKYFSIEDGKACNSGPKASFLNACSEDLGTSDFTANLNGITVDRTGNGNTGFDFMFRSQDEKNGYHFTYNSKSNIVRFWKRVNGKWVQLNTAKVPSEWGNQELNFQIKVEGDTFTAYKDGKPILQASDDAYDQGKYGIRNKPGSKTCFDNISLQ